jgi:hypothetical protein
MPSEGNADEFLEQYRLAVEMADRVSARRATANTFFLTINTLTISFVGTGLFDSPRLIAVGGLALSITWWVLLKSYRDLNRAKFEVINRMEDRLEAKVFREEWDILKKDNVKWWRGRYAEFGTVERVVPVIFAVLYIAALLGV